MTAALARPYSHLARVYDQAVGQTRFLRTRRGFEATLPDRPFANHLHCSFLFADIAICYLPLDAIHPVKLLRQRLLIEHQRVTTVSKVGYDMLESSPVETFQLLCCVDTKGKGRDYSQGVKGGSSVFLTLFPPFLGVSLFPQR